MPTRLEPDAKFGRPAFRRQGLLATWAYRTRVGILLGLFVFAMIENSRHPFPLWAGILRFFDVKMADITSNDRHLALLLPVGLYGASLLLRLSATAALGSRTVWSSRPATGGLVEDGLFSCVRHPLYVGSAGMILSLSLMSSLAGAVILVGGGIPFLAFLARHEEAELLRNLPGYADYRKRVPAFFPVPGSGCRLRQAIAGPLRENIGRGLRSEAANVGLLGGFLSFWATPNILLFWIAFLLALAFALTAPIWIPGRSGGVR